MAGNGTADNEVAPRKSHYLNYFQHVLMISMVMHQPQRQPISLFIIILFLSILTVTYRSKLIRSLLYSKSHHPEVILIISLIDQLLFFAHFGRFIDFTRKTFTARMIDQGFFCIFRRIRYFLDTNILSIQDTISIRFFKQARVKRKVILDLAVISEFS